MRHVRPVRWYQQLRWRLSLLYVGVTVGLILIGFAVGEITTYFRYQSINQPATVARATARRVAELAPYLQSAPVNRVALTLWLAQENERIKNGTGEWPGLSFYSEPMIYAAVADTRGSILAEYPSGQKLSTGLAAEGPLLADAGLIQLALAGETSPNQLSAVEPDGTLVAAAPILDKGQVVGVRLLHSYAPFIWRVHLVRIASDLAAPLLMFITLAFVVGQGFGLVTTRRLVKRLEVISTTSDAWARGDFSAAVVDEGKDEVGQLARRLNSMAEELHSVLALRQELAGMEERNRLARDLHDTVKQQIFALSMQIGAAQARLNGGSPEVHKRLEEAASLARQVQNELVTIIKELQPVGQTGKGLEPTLREHAVNWARQSGVAAEVHFEQGLQLIPEAEHAFLRITQEALSNISRHSGASEATVRLANTTDSGTALSIEDNGEGFDAAKVNGGMGLRNMRERAEALPGGWFEFESRKGKGTRVIAGYHPATTK